MIFRNDKLAVKPGKESVQRLRAAAVTMTITTSARGRSPVLVPRVEARNELTSQRSGPSKQAALVSSVTAIKASEPG